MSVLKKKVLLLNQTFEPIAILPAKKVLKKIVKGSKSFYVEEYYEGIIHSGIKIPSVVRLTYYLNVKRAVRVTVGKKAKIFARDSYKCVYCGYAGMSNELTLDHVIPKGQGGDSSYFNLVTCCRDCNSLKSCRSDEEFGYKVPKALLHSNVNLALLISSARQNPQWKKYLYN